MKNPLSYGKSRVALFKIPAKGSFYMGVFQDPPLKIFFHYAFNIFDCYVKRLRLNFKKPVLDMTLE